MSLCQLFSFGTFTILQNFHDASHCNSTAADRRDGATGCFTAKTVHDLQMIITVIHSNALNSHLLPWRLTRYHRSSGNQENYETMFQPMMKRGRGQINRVMLTERIDSTFSNDLCSFVSQR